MCVSAPEMLMSLIVCAGKPIEWILSTGGYRCMNAELQRFLCFALAHSWHKTYDQCHWIFLGTLLAEMWLVYGKMSRMKTFPICQV